MKNNKRNKLKFEYKNNKVGKIRNSGHSFVKTECKLNKLDFFPLKLFQAFLPIQVVELSL